MHKVSKKMCNEQFQTAFRFNGISSWCVHLATRVIFPSGNVKSDKYSVVWTK